MRKQLYLHREGDPILHQEAQAVGMPDPELDGLIAAMWRLMDRHGGIGLAANQVGVLKCVIVIHVDGFRQAFINPIIERRYGGTTTRHEGCLSFPGVQVLKVRHRQIVVTGLDAQGTPIKRKLKNWAAIAVQHEVDHLWGVTIR